MTISNEYLFSHFDEKEINKIVYFSKFFDVNTFIIQHLFLNGIKEEEKIFRFLNPSLNYLYDPFLLNDMKKAVYRIFRAISKNELILIYGDYDCDGISSTSILYHALKRLGAKVKYRIPTRKDGYGLNENVVRQLKAKYNDLSLIITVDNGSNAHGACSHCYDLQIDLIVTDHHEITSHFPKCLAFINPKRNDNTYPFSHLAGVGVTFKLIQALFSVKKMKIDSFIWDYIELVALGTIADMVPLQDENRILASFGIKKWNEHPSPFFRSLFQEMYLNKITSSDISFRIGPLINSIGRISDSNPIPILMNSNDSYINVAPLIKLNRLRKKLCDIQFTKCEMSIKNQISSNKDILIAYGNFHEGIIGILSSRISEKYQRPSIVITHSGKGSARSGNSSIHMTNLLSEAKELLTNYGGHEGAAGLSLDTSNVQPFIKKINSLSIKNNVSYIRDRDFHSTIEDKKIPTLPLFDFSTSLGKDFFLLEPFGMGNKKPIFHDNSFFFHDISFFGSNKEYFKMFSNQFEILSFQQFDGVSFYRNKPFEILYTPVSDHQFMVEDIHFPTEETLVQSI